VHACTLTPCTCAPPAASRGGPPLGTNYVFTGFLNGTTVFTQSGVVTSLGGLPPFVLVAGTATGLAINALTFMMRGCAPDHGTLPR